MPRPVPGPVERRWVGSWRRRGEEGGHVMDKQSKTKNCPVVVQQTREDGRWTHGHHKHNHEPVGKLDNMLLQ